MRQVKLLAVLLTAVLLKPVQAMGGEQTIPDAIASTHSRLESAVRSQLAGFVPRTDAVFIELLPTAFPFRSTDNPELPVLLAADSVPGDKHLIEIGTRRVSTEARRLLAGLVWLSLADGEPLPERLVRPAPLGGRLRQVTRGTEPRPELLDRIYLDAALLEHMAVVESGGVGDVSQIMYPGLLDKVLRLAEVDRNNRGYSEWVDRLREWNYVSRIRSRFNEIGEGKELQDQIVLEPSRREWADDSAPWQILRVRDTGESDREVRLRVMVVRVKRDWLPLDLFVRERAWGYVDGEKQWVGVGTPGYGSDARSWLLHRVPTAMLVVSEIEADADISDPYLRQWQSCLQSSSRATGQNGPVSMICVAVFAAPLPARLELSRLERSPTMRGSQR